jgi:hypothetical protein
VLHSLIFFRSRAGIAILASVLLGAVFTGIWARTSHWFLRKCFQFPPDNLGFLIGVLMGIVERLLLTITTLWEPQALGPIAAALIAVKEILGWADLKPKDNDRPSRIRYSVSFMNNLVSVIWAISWGIWGMPNNSN